MILSPNQIAVYFEMILSPNQIAVYFEIILTPNQIAVYFEIILSPNQIAVYFENLKFCFMKTAITLVYIKYCTVCLKIDYTLRCLEYICSVSLG